MRNPCGIKARINNFFVPYLSIRRQLPFLPSILLLFTVTALIVIAEVAMERSLPIGSHNSFTNPATQSSSLRSELAECLPVSLYRQDMVTRSLKASPPVIQNETLFQGDSFYYHLPKTKLNEYS